MAATCWFILALSAPLATSSLATPARRRKPSHSATRRRPPAVSLSRPDDASLSVDLPGGGKLAVTYTASAACVEAWLARHGSSPLGFDTETRPVFTKGQSRAPATLQLAGEGTCLVIHLAHLELDSAGGWPPGLVDVLQNRSILKVCATACRCMAFSWNPSALHRRASAWLTTPSSCGRAMVMSCAGVSSWVAFTPMRQLGGSSSASRRWQRLSSGARAGLGLCVKGHPWSRERVDALNAHVYSMHSVEVPKSAAITKSNWEASPLQTKQLVYAALDSWVGREVFVALGKLEPSFTQPSAQRTAASERSIPELYARRWLLRWEGCSRWAKGDVASIAIDCMPMHA